MGLIVKDEQVKASTAGFSLLEVLIATAIFTFSALGMLGLEMRILQASNQARRLSDATQLAQYPIEAFKSAPFAAVYDFVPQADSDGINTYTVNLNDIDLDDLYRSSENYLSDPGFADDSTAQKILQEWLVQFAEKGLRNEGNELIYKGTLKMELVKDGGEIIGADMWTTVNWIDNTDTGSRLRTVSMSQRLANAW